MLSRKQIGTFGTCGAQTLLGEAYSATPLGGELVSHPPTLDLPRRTAEDHHLPKVPLNNGLSDGLHAARTVTTFFGPNLFYQGYGLRHALLQYLISVSSGAVVSKCNDWKEERLPPPR